MVVGVVSVDAKGKRLDLRVNVVGDRDAAGQIGFSRFLSLGRCQAKRAEEAGCSAGVQAAAESREHLRRLFADPTQQAPGFQHTFIDPGAIVWSNNKPDSIHQSVPVISGVKACYARVLVKIRGVGVSFR